MNKELFLYSDNIVMCAVKYLVPYKHPVSQVICPILLLNSLIDEIDCIG